MHIYKIVLIENDEDERFFMKEAFANSGLFDIVAEFRNGDPLMEWLEAQPESRPDVILSDLNMHGKNGYEVIQDVKSNSGFADIPVVITSTSQIRSVIDRCLSLGADDYLVKPEVFTHYEDFVIELHKRIGGADRQLA